jgi:hypothetical protein
MPAAVWQSNSYAVHGIEDISVTQALGPVRQRAASSK